MSSCQKDVKCQKVKHMDYGGGSQSSLEKHITQLQEYDWPNVYLKRQTGLISYVVELNFFLHSISNKFDFLYSTMIDEIKALVKGIATQSKGRITPELFPPSFLQNITIRVMSELLKSNTGYKLAFPQIDAYYDMMVTTFSLDKDNNLIVTFPILIEPIPNKPLSLYEIETVPVPIVDMDKSADSFSEVHVSKPYIAASPIAYIQLREPELQRCKVVQQQYYCEEAFMVKHAHHDTCESSLFYNRDKEKITQVCKFSSFMSILLSPVFLMGVPTLCWPTFILNTALLVIPRFSLTFQIEITPSPSETFCAIVLYNPISHICPVI